MLGSSSQREKHSCIYVFRWWTNVFCAKNIGDVSAAQPSFDYGAVFMKKIQTHDAVGSVLSWWISRTIMTHMLVCFLERSEREVFLEMCPVTWKALEPSTSRRVTRALENTSVRWEWTSWQEKVRLGIPHVFENPCHCCGWRVNNATPRLNFVPPDTVHISKGIVSEYFRKC